MLPFPGVSGLPLKPGKSECGQNSLGNNEDEVRPLGFLFTIRILTLKSQQLSKIPQPRPNVWQKIRSGNASLQEAAIQELIHYTHVQQLEAPHHHFLAHSLHNVIAQLLRLLLSSSR